jgi:hypothetical protein
MLLNPNRNPPVSTVGRFNLKMVYRGTLSDLQAWAESKKLAWKNSSKDTFGGYWYDGKTHNAYIIT